MSSNMELTLKSPLLALRVCCYPCLKSVVVMERSVQIRNFIRSNLQDNCVICNYWSINSTIIMPITGGQMILSGCILCLVL